MKTVYYKVFDGNGKTLYGRPAWPPGKWMPRIKGELVACKNGYHLCEERDLLDWLGPEIWEAETREKVLRAENKAVARQARITKRTGMTEKRLRLFALDCAEHVLPLFEKTYPKDKRPRKCIETMRRYLEGKATEEEESAARSAARSAWSAERTWQLKRYIHYVRMPAETRRESR